MSETMNDLARRLEETEAERDALALALARMEDANAERVPASLVRRLAAGDNPARVWREHRGMTQRALADAAGISPALMNEIEAGKKEGSIRTLLAIARALRLDLDDLVAWADD
jgi:DNA-binding XRE family transcriptional regulator